MAKINFGGVLENVVTRKEFPLKKAREILKNETIAVIGYGVQGPAQALNLRDNGLMSSLVNETSKSWDKAVKDDWKPGKTLFEVEEAVKKYYHLLSPISTPDKFSWSLSKNLSSEKLYTFPWIWNYFLKEIIPPKILTLSNCSKRIRKNCQKIIFRRKRY